MSIVQTLERIDFDIKHLIWQAKIYGLPSRTIASKFNIIRDKHLSLADGDDKQAVGEALARWYKEINVMVALQCPYAATCPERRRCF